MQYVGLPVFNWPFLALVIEYIHKLSCHHNHIGSINLSHCCHPSSFVVVCMGWLYHHIHLFHIYSEEVGLYFHCNCVVHEVYKWSGTLWLEDHVRLFAYHYYADLYWKHWTYIKLVRYILPNVCLTFTQYAQLSSLQITGLCVLAYPFFFCWLWECVFIYIYIINVKSEVWIISHCSWIRSWTMMHVVCIAIFLLYTIC